MTTESPPGVRHTAAFLARGTVVFTAALLLTSLGGAGIFASPVTIPLLLLIAVFSPEHGWRAAAAVIGGLTATEVVWAVVSWWVWSHGVGTFAVGVTGGILVGVGLWKSRRLVARGETQLRHPSEQIT